MRKEEEIQRALAAYKAAIEHAEARRSSKLPLSSEETPVRRPNEPEAGSTRCPRPSVPLRDSITDYSKIELLELIEWINSDGRLRTDDEIIEELLPELGFSRRGARIEAMLRDLLYQCRNQSRSDPSAEEL
jgi:hypothetical protein